MKLTFSRYNGVISRGANDFRDAFVKIHVPSVNVRESVFDGAFVHLQFNDFLLDVVSIQFCFRLCRFEKSLKHIIFHSKCKSSKTSIIINRKHDISHS
jgi:hypothetical protein